MIDIRHQRRVRCCCLLADRLAPFTRYNLLSNRFDNRLNVCIHDTTGCQTGLTTGCIMYTNIQPTGCIVYTADCQIGCTTQFDNRLNEQWLFVQHCCQTGCQTVRQPAVLCYFDNRLYRVNRVFAKWFALRHRSIVCLSACNVGALWPNGWMDQDETWHAGRPQPQTDCVRWGPSSTPKGHSPQFLAHVCCGQTA